MLFYFLPSSTDGIIAQPTPTRLSTPAAAAFSLGVFIPFQGTTGADDIIPDDPDTTASIASGSSSLPGAAEPITSTRLHTVTKPPDSEGVAIERGTTVRPSLEHRTIIHISQTSATLEDVFQFELRSSQLVQG